MLPTSKGPRRILQPPFYPSCNMNPNMKCCNFILMPWSIGDEIFPAWIRIQIFCILNHTLCASNEEILVLHSLMILNIYSFSKIYKHVLAKVRWKINMTRTIKPMTRSNPHPACIPPFLLFLYSLYHSKKANLEYRVFKNDLQNQNCQDYYKQENISLV